MIRYFITIIAIKYLVIVIMIVIMITYQNCRFDACFTHFYNFSLKFVEDL